LEHLISAGAASADVGSAKEQLRAQLEPLLEQLQSSLSSPAPEATSSSPAPEVSTAKVSSAAAQLLNLLSECDAGATDFIEANQSALRPLFANEAWTRFKKLVEGYSFADAQTQLKEAVERLSPA